MASFDENGKYIKTNWKAGDKITATKLNKIEESIEAVNDNDISRHVEADARLDALEAKDVTHDKELTKIKNTIADNKAAAELGDYEINSRMTFLENELNEGIEEVHNVAETVDGKIAQGKADMEAMVAEVEADLEGLHAKDEELSEQLEQKANELEGIEVNINKYKHIDNIKERIEHALSLHSYVKVPSGVYVLDGLNIPEGKTLEFVGLTNIEITNSITVGYGSTLKGKQTTIITNVRTEKFSLINLSKNSIVDLYCLIGYREEGAPKGNGTNAIGINATHSDFVNVYVEIIRQCKYAYYLQGGATGSGNTINDSFFRSKWIANCYYCFYQDGGSQTHIYTEAYMEYCNIGYSLNNSFYGRHYMTFDNVEQMFEARNTDWKNRMGQVYIANLSIEDFIERTDRYFQDTTFNLKNGIIIPKAVEAANIVSSKDSKLFLKSGDTEFRMTSSSSLSYEGKVSPNDTSDGITATIGNNGSFSIERNTRDKIMNLSYTGNLSTRGKIMVGDSSVGYSNLEISKGCLVFNETIYNSSSNAPINSIFIDYSDNKLKFKDKDGNIKTISLE